MKPIDLTSPEKALAYLRSLAANTEIEIIDARSALPNAETDAVAAIVGESAISWAHNRGRYVWTARALVQALETEMASAD